MVYAEGSFAAPSETEQNCLEPSVLRRESAACFLEAVPDGKIDALRQEADGDETICVSTPSAPPVANAAGMSPAQPSERASAAPSAEAAPGARLYRHLGAAVDIGTTTIAAVLYREGRAVGTMGHGIRSPCSERMSSAGWKLPWREKQINLRQSSGRQCRACLRSWQNTQEKDAEAIETVIITGNTSMLYFLTQKDPRCLSRA